jgi:hypothetical protein
VEELRVEDARLKDFRDLSKRSFKGFVSMERLFRKSQIEGPYVEKGVSLKRTGLPQAKGSGA